MHVVLTGWYRGGVEGEAKRFVLDPMLGSDIHLLSDLSTPRSRERGSESALPLVLPDGRHAAPPPFGGLDPRMVADWTAHTAPSPTPTDLDLPLPIGWFTDAEWAALEKLVVTGEGIFNENARLWSAFYAKHPDSTGWIHMTDVGFSPDGTTALIYVVRVAGGLNGSGAWFLLEKRDGTWTVLGQKRTWIA
jgi:hypothetical protein